MSALPTEFAPYDLFAHELVGVGHIHRSVLGRLDPDEVRDHRSRGVWQFFIVSRVLSQRLLDQVETASLQLVALNGAIGLQVSAPPTGAGLDLTLTLTAVRGDNVVRHDGYERVFRAAVTKARRLSR
jgi:hypothetical protein